MCRLVGIAADNDVAPHIIMSLAAQNYAGEESCGIALERGGQFTVETGIGIANKVFGRFHSEDVGGNTGIGHIACRTGGVQPLVVKNSRRTVALCADSTKEVCCKIAEILSDCREPEKAVGKAMLKIKEPFSLLILQSSGKIIAARNNGRMPLSYGELVDGKRGSYVASQSGVLGLDARFIHSISPGEMVVITRNSFQRKAVLSNPDLTRCSQELLFWQRPGNYCANRDTNTTRQLVGRALGEKFRKRVPVENPQEYIAIPILEGGASIILGYGQTAGIPIDPAGSVKSRYPKPSFMPANIDLFPIGEIVKGKKTVIVDDAFISGGKLKMMAERSLEFGATEVHAVIGAIIQRSCPFGKDILSKDHKSATRLIKDLGLASFTSLTPKEFVKAIDIPHRIYCFECLKA